MRTVGLSCARWLWLPIVASTACGPETGEHFEHGLDTDAVPWTHERFDDAPGQFTFAVFADLNGGERDGVFSVAAAQLALLRPELVLNVGDLIEGAAEDAADLAREWDSFDERADVIPAPVFRVGGNHDLTGPVRREVWAERYGPHYYHFLYKDVLFLVLDTEDHAATRLREMLDAGSTTVQALVAGIAGADSPGRDPVLEHATGNIGRAQSAHFRKVLAENADVRWTMLFMHKPMWQGAQDPDFVALEDAMTDRPYTVFSGHHHSMSHATRNGRDYITLGTTGGFQVRDDPMSFDHITLVTVADDGPSIAHLRLDGVLAKDGEVPAGGAQSCPQASACERPR